MTTQQQNYDKFVARWKEQEQEVKNAAKNEPHTLSKAKHRADLERRGNQHRRNGFYYIKIRRHGRRGVYDEVDTAESRLEHALTKSGKRRAPNFLSGSYPYQNEAHHLLPVKAFSRTHFGADQLRLMMKLPYCINHGENIIFLPKRDDLCEIHGLPKHSGRHSAYNTAVATDAKTFAKKLVEQAQQPCDPEKPIQLAVLRDLILCEKKYWNLLVSAGPLTNVRRVGLERMEQQATTVQPSTRDM